MKKLLLALALFCAPPAHAAPPSCWPDVPVQFSKIEVTTPELGDILYTASSVGLVWGYTCKAADGKWYKVIGGGPWSAWPSDWLFILDTAIRGTDEQRRALWDKYATAAAWDDRLKPDLDALWAKLPNPPPPPAEVVWKVLADPFRADKKRPIYTVVNGRRGSLTGRYVDAGAPCDPATTIQEFGGVTFMAVNGNLSTVARCSK